MAGKQARPAQGRARIDDVAGLAAVSIKTVSRVLNDEPNVSAQTRRKVLDAIRSLQYAPSPEARRLAESKSRSNHWLHADPLQHASAAAHGAPRPDNRQNGSRLHAELVELVALRERGVITRNEFEAQIGWLLARQQ